MVSSFFKRRKILKGVNYLALTPVRLKDYEDLGDGKVAIIFPKFKNNKWRFLIPKYKSDHIKIKLDELGTATWLAIDGKRTVKEICEYLDHKYGERIHPVEERTTKFLTTLYEQRYISFAELSRKD